MNSQGETHFIFWKIFTTWTGSCGLLSWYIFGSCLPFTDFTRMTVFFFLLWTYLMIWISQISLWDAKLYPSGIKMLPLLLLFSRWVVSNSFAIPGTVARQVPLSMGFPRQEYWSVLPFPSPGNLSDPGIEPKFPALADRFLYDWTTLEAPKCYSTAWYLCSILAKRTLCSC